MENIVLNIAEANSLLLDIIDVLNAPNCYVSRYGYTYHVSNNGSSVHVECRTEYGHRFVTGRYVYHRIYVRKDSEQTVSCNYANENLIEAVVYALSTKCDECTKREENKTQKEAVNKIKNVISSMCSQNSKE